MMTHFEREALGRVPAVAHFSGGGGTLDGRVLPQPLGGFFFLGGGSTVEVYEKKTDGLFCYLRTMNCTVEEAMKDYC